MDFKLDEDGFCWVARAKLASWRGYFDRSGSYGGPGPDAVSDGTVELVFAPEGRDTSPLTAAELALVEWALANERAVSDAARAAICAEYPTLREFYGYSPEEAAAYMPDIASADDLRTLIGLYAFNVHPIGKDGVPYIGLELGCTWDDEHGLGVLMHGTRCVEVGGSDTARLLWMVEQDAAS